MRRTVALCLLSVLTLAADTYLFTSFRQNGQTGIFFALSNDGRKWEALGSGAWIKPEQPGMLMRDPYLVRGPEGVYHMIWTWGWTRKGSGRSPEARLLEFA